MLCSEYAMSKHAMSKHEQSSDEQPSLSVWQRHRMPIILGIVAVCLYAGSIVWMVFGPSQLG